MTFADLAQKILGEATTPDPRGLTSPAVGIIGFNPPIPEYKRKHPVDSIGAGGTVSKKMLRNAFRLLRNDSDLSSRVNDILTDYQLKRKSISHEDEVIIVNNSNTIDVNQNKLDTYLKALQKHNEGEAILSDPDNVKKRIRGLKSDIEDLKAELMPILEKVEKYPKINEENEKEYRDKLITVTKQAAENLIEKLNIPREAVKSVNSLDDLDQLFTTDEEMQQQETKLAVLKSLTDNDLQKNILLKFLDLALNRYNEFKSSRSQSGPLATIELTKEFNRLPLSVFLMFYNSSIKDSSEIKLQPLTAGAKALQGGMVGSQAGKKVAQKKSPELVKANTLLGRNFGTNNINVAAQAKAFVKDSAVGPRTLEKLYGIIDDIISGVEGSPAAFARYVYGQEPITESFNSLVDQYLTEAKKGARCTKVTGQQSSSRSDKKYMRCARVDGKLKRIH